MNFKHFLTIGLLPVLIIGCRETPEPSLQLPTPKKESYGAGLPMPDSAAYYDRILGALVGSAIGDAMGASTEMWDRASIRRTYGYINSLTPAVRYKSPEGTWEHNLGAGATTDDTRWKAFMVSYIQKNRNDLNPSAFAAQIAEYYRETAAELGDRTIRESPDALDSKLDRVHWIGEWARVAMAYAEGPEAYLEAKDRFYGGEMSCAGMLYTPVFGLIASDPEAAYEVAYAHTLFDLGYARDIAALVAAMTRTALQTKDMDSLLNTAIFTDPLEFQDSRLVGRLSLATALSARDYVKRARLLPDPGTGLDPDSLARSIPAAYPGNPDSWLRQEYIYALLEKDQKAIPFHAGEIWQILIAALEYGEGDFQRTMAFIVNYGRDNDTVAAVAGMILGAQMGFERLPEAEREQILRVNRDQLGIDLEKMAGILSNRP